jgi:hypothetical protein
MPVAPPVAREHQSHIVEPGRSYVPSKRKPRAAQKVTCEDCYFRCHQLCALQLSEPCATFRPDASQLRPPQQLRFVFRQENRPRSAWVFRSAQEQAALYA